FEFNSKMGLGTYFFAERNPPPPFSMKLLARNQQQMKSPLRSDGDLGEDFAAHLFTQHSELSTFLLRTVDYAAMSPITQSTWHILNHPASLIHIHLPCCTLKSSMYNSECERA